MKRMILIHMLIACVLLLSPSFTLAQEEQKTSSVHAGFLYPNGVDVLGYTVERSLHNNVYFFYTFGFPSLVAAGLSYYANYSGNGLSATLGVGIGSILYGSLAYQWRIDDVQYIKAGAGGTTGIAYTGLFPALSYEYRF